MLSLLMLTVTHAHDIWLQPDRFVLSKGDTLTVRQFVGIELETEEEIELLRRMTPRFDLITPDGVVDLLSELPDMRTQPFVKPVLTRKLDFEGLALVTMDHAFIHEGWSHEQFLEYLEHEEYNVEDFKDRMSGNRGELERYARTLKSLIHVGGVGAVAEGDAYKRVLGQKIEIVLLQNPYLLDPGDDLEARVLFEGEPLRDRAVMAFNTDGQRPVSESIARTNADGIVQFKLDQSGIWLI